MHRHLAAQLSLLLAVVASPAWADDSALPTLVTDNFEEGMSAWRNMDPEGSEPSWLISTLEDGNQVLRTLGTSTYQPEFRSPPNYTLRDDVVVGDFSIRVRLQNTNIDAGYHRDLCLFFGWQDPNHYYYVHLGAAADDHSCQVFVVNEAPRTKITKNETTGTKWTEGWHEVMLTRDVESGRIEVYFDDMDTPMMIAEDKHFTWGKVGLGTFDDNGNFDEFVLKGNLHEPASEAAGSGSR